jgi:hypothetical protein
MFSLRPGHAGRQHAGAAHDQVDARTGLASHQQRLDQRRVGQRIDLGDDARHAAGARRRGATCPQVGQHAAVQLERRLTAGAVAAHRAWLASCWNTASASAVRPGRR